MANNAIMLCKVDREDLWVTGGRVFRYDGKRLCDDAYNAIQQRIETPEFVEDVIKEHCLESDLFQDDESYRFTRTESNMSNVTFVFTNSAGDIQNFRMKMEFVTIMD